MRHLTAKLCFKLTSIYLRSIARTEHDAVVGTSEKDIAFMNIKALNEWDSRYSGNIDWRQKLDVQRGAVLANELKHNACKLSRYVFYREQSSRSSRNYFDEGEAKKF